MRLAQVERVAQTEAVGLDLPEFYRARAPDPARSLTVRSARLPQARPRSWHAQGATDPPRTAIKRCT